MILCTGCPTTTKPGISLIILVILGKTSFSFLFFGILAKKDKTFFKNSFLTMMLCTGCPTTYQTRHFFNNSSNSGENKFFFLIFLAY